MATRYQLVYQDLHAKIDEGTYAPGTVLPSEPDLARAYGVSRPTVRHALQLLADEGLVDRRRNRGTMVLEPKIEQGFAMRIRSFADEMRAARRLPRTSVLACEVVPASPEAASALGIGSGKPVLRLVRLRYADDLPNVLVETTVPHERYRGIEVTDFEHASLYATMRKMGSPVVSALRRLDVALADRSTAGILGIEPGAPVFVFHTVATNSDGLPAEYSIATYRGDTNSFELETRIM